jgi:hypothetical protein
MVHKFVSFVYVTFTQILLTYGWHGTVLFFFFLFHFDWKQCLVYKNDDICFSDVGLIYFYK